MPTPLKNLVILISGNGSNLQAFIDAQKSGAPFHIAAVISNKPDAYGLTRAKNAGIPTQVINHRNFDSREQFDKTLQTAIDQHNPSLVILAGFMRLLTPGFVAHYPNRLLNIHPSLLPKYKGLNTHQRVIDAGEQEHGCTVHYVTDALDAGPILGQASCPVEPNDTPESLKHKVHALEHALYVDVVINTL